MIKKHQYERTLELIQKRIIEKQKEFTWKEFNQIEPELRKARWIQFKNVFPEHAEIWESTEGCNESKCNHRTDGWCDYTDFPCGYNPFLSPRTGMVGMACMGAVPKKRRPS